MRCAPVIVVALVGLLAGCLGEAGVEYQGIVHDGETAGHVFTVYRDLRSPIAGAEVELLLDDAIVESTTTDDNGVFPALSALFPYSPGHDHEIEIRTTALDGRSYTYRTVYEDTKDPTYSTSCEDLEAYCPVTLLDIRLAR